MKLINSKEEILKLKTKINNIENLDLVKTDLIEQRDALFEYLSNEPNAAGISAIQLGIESPSFAIKNIRDNNSLVFCVNASVDSYANPFFNIEGCMSLRFDENHIYTYIPRFNKINTKFWSLNHKNEIKKYNKSFSGLSSCAFQHEMNHINGILILDVAIPVEMQDVREEMKAEKNVWRLDIREDLRKDGKYYDVDYIIDGDEVTLYNKLTLDSFKQEKTLVGIILKEKKVENKDNSDKV